MSTIHGRPPRLSLLLVVAVSSAAILALAGIGLSCSGDEAPAVELPTGGTGGAGGSNVGGWTTGGTGGGGLQPPSHYDDFPEDPIVEDGLPADIADLFAGATGSDSGGPCLAEPTLDAMVPRNWTPLFFEWQAPSEQNVFELRLEVDNQLNDLVVYTTNPSYAMARVLWTSFADHSAGQDVGLTLRGATMEGSAITAGPFLGAEGAIHIAPVAAPGSVVYWTASSGSSFDGFMIGDDAPVTVLTPASAGSTSTGGSTTCVSCHTSSPDGELIIYTRDADDGTRAVDVRMVDGSGSPAASVITPTALTLLGRHKQAAPLLSAAHYQPGDSVALGIFFDATLTSNHNEIIWTDLEADDANDWGIIARNGDAREASSPAWSRDGTTIAYVSSDTAGEGVIAAGNPDIYTVPYNNRAGGSATPLSGAAEAAYVEYYPVYSPGDAWIAFNRHDQAADSYDEPAAEVFVVAAAGGTPTRLRANDPPACSGLTSPGVTNSWARWAPTAEEYDGQRYYWLVFSSKRRSPENAPTDPPKPQLYIAAVVTAEQGGVETIVEDYPALYVRSQDPNENNHIPAWENFVVDQIPR